MTRADDIEFFELSSPDDQMSPDGGSAPGDVFGPATEPDLIQVGAPERPPSPRPDTWAGRLAGVGDQVRAVPTPVRVVAALCVGVVAAGAFALGRASHRDSASEVPVTVVPVPATSTAASSDAYSQFQQFGHPMASSAVTAQPVGESCRGESQSIYLDTAPNNLVTSVKRWVPQAVIAAGSSVVNESGTQCSATVVARVGSDGALLTLTVEAPAADFVSDGTTVDVASDAGELPRVQSTTVDGWTIEAAVDAPSSVTDSQLGELAFDPSIITRPAVNGGHGAD